MKTKPENTHTFTFLAEGESYTVDIEKLEKPLWLIYSAFRDLKYSGYADEDEVFYKLAMALEDLIYSSRDNSPIAIKHHADKVVLITRTLTACAMICNSFNIVKDKK